MKQLPRHPRNADRHRADGPQRARSRGLTITELLVTMGIMAILVGLTIVVLSGARKSRDQAQCAANLHAIGMAFVNYNGDYLDYYPVPTPTAQWEDLLREYISRSTFHCPADTELYAALSSSYDWRDTGNPRTTLAGRMTTQLAHTDVVLAFDALPGWHARGKVQILRADSSVDMSDMNSFFQDLQRSPTEP